MSLITLAASATLVASAITSSPAWASGGYGEVGSLGAGELSNPVGVAVNQESGDVYTAGLLGQGVVEFAANGQQIRRFDSEFYLSGVAVDPVNGDVYVLNAGSQTIETYTAAGAGPISSFSVEGSANLFGILSVVQIASDSAGNVYLPNAPSDEVQEFSASGALVQTFTGSGSAALNEPTGVAVDASGQVYIADSGNGRVEEFSPSGAVLGSIAAPGVQAVALDGSGDVLAGELNAEDGCGSLASPCFHVVVHDPAGGQLADFGAGAVGTSEFETIDTLAVGPTGLVYVADGANDAVWTYAYQSEPGLLAVSSFAVTQSTATLRAEIDPGNLDTTYRFEYGACATAATCPGSPYATSAPAPDADIGNGLSGGPVIVSQQLTGLQPGSTYHYRVVAINAAGTTTGAEHTFATPPPQAPIVASGQALGVTQNDATLTGTVETQGFQTEYEFDIGTDTGYGVRIFGDAGTEPGIQTFTAPLQGLAPGTTYHYRIAATNIFGTTYGADEMFTTAIYPTSALSAPSGSPLIPAIVLAPARNAGTEDVVHAKRVKHKKRRNDARRSRGRPRRDRRVSRRSQTARARRANPERSM